MISRTLHHTVLALIVFIWVVPFIALVTTSLRSELASKTSGFWTASTRQSWATASVHMIRAIPKKFWS